MLRHLHRFHQSRSERAQFARFALVGVTISVIDAAVLYLLLALGVDAHLGRVFSLAASVTGGYLLNRRFTFHHVETGRSLWESLLRHYSVNAIGSALNMGVYSAVLLVGQQLGGQVAAATTLPLLAIWVGGMAGMSFNFVFSKRLVFDS